MPERLLFRTKMRSQLARALRFLAWPLALGCTGNIGAESVGAISSSGSMSDASTSGSSGSASGAGTTPACTALPVVPRRLWRLSVEQYGNGVRDLLGLSAPPVLDNRGGEPAYALFSDASLGVDASFQFALYQTSQSILSSLTAAQVTQLAACGSQNPAPCATSFAQTFGKKVFRRPLDAGEVANLMKVYAQGALQDFNTGIGLMIQALIISPSFIYRTELGPSALTVDASGNYPDTTMTPYEIASQLGFLFLGSTPDASLLAAADDGSLATTAGLSTQIERLLALPAVKTNLTSIVIDWFNVRQMFDKTKDTSLLSALSAADQDQTGIENDLLTATQQFVTDVLWTKSGKIDDLVTSQEMFVNQRLATLFPGLIYAGAPPSSNTTFALATWPASQGRSGMLTQPSFLWSASDPALTSVVKRGKFIHDDIVCQNPLPPPVDLTTPSAMNVISCKPPGWVAGDPVPPCDSEILQSNARMMYQPCTSCHSQMDPYARVLQNFGPIGNYRSVDEANRAIDPSVTFVPSSPLAPETISGAPAFGKALVSNGIVNACSVQKIASYAIGSMIRTYDTCEVERLRTQVDGTVASLFRQVALANFTRARAGGAK
jgi:hypothetical protein